MSKTDKFSLKMTGVNTVTHPHLIPIGQGTPLTKEHTEEIRSLGESEGCLFTSCLPQVCERETHPSHTFFMIVYATHLNQESDFVLWCMLCFFLKCLRCTNVPRGSRSEEGHVVTLGLEKTIRWLISHQDLWNKALTHDQPLWQDVVNDQIVMIDCALMRWSGFDVNPWRMHYNPTVWNRGGSSVTFSPLTM